MHHVSGREMKVKFSIITVSFNSAETIEETIKSVLAQTYGDFEYIIVDGTSTDGTLDIIKSYAKKDERIRYISEPDKGIYDAMNKGIKMAEGELIGLLNSDDYYEPDALEKIVLQVQEGFRPLDEVVLYGMVRILKEEKESMVIIYSHDSLPERMMMHPACFVSKEIYANYQYDTRYKSAADYDLFIRLYQDQEVQFIPVYDIISNFRLGGMSSNSISYLETNDIRYKYGYISKRQRNIGNLGIKAKRLLLHRN